jgi:hypothetical protein
VVQTSQGIPRPRAHPGPLPPPPTARSNDVYLHTDEAFMPVLKKTWSSWNFLGTSQGPAAGDNAAVCVTYWLNKLQVGPPGKGLAAAKGGLTRGRGTAGGQRDWGEGAHGRSVRALALLVGLLPAHVAWLRSHTVPHRRPSLEPAAQHAAAVRDAQPPDPAGRGQDHQAPGAGAPGVFVCLVSRAGARAVHPRHRRRLLRG